MKFTIKKVMSIAMATVIVFATISTANITYVSASTLPEYIKIGLKYASSEQEQEVVFEDGIKLGVADVNGFTVLAEFQDIKTIKLTIEGGNVRLIGINMSGEQVGLTEIYPTVNCVMPYGDSDNSVFSFKGSKYRGGVMYNAISGSLNVINYIQLEQYLYGVVNGELNKSNPSEALKAQAVAARSFAGCKLGNHNSYGFDLCSTTHCQVYKGFNDEYAETTQAVDETQGDTVNYDGKPVAAFFYKNSGGHTQSGEDVWGGKTGYLYGIEDEYSPTYTWSQSYTFSEMESKLSGAGYNIGTLSNVSITKRNKSGAVETLQFTGSAGNAVLQKEKIRTVLGATIIKSTMFSLSDSINSGNNGGTEGETATFEAHGLTKYENVGRELDQKIYVINNSGTVDKIQTKDVYVSNGSKTEKIENMSNKSENNQVLTGVESVSSGNITFVGKGYGHGVGMPQDSAVEMAKKDFTYKEILKYYYTDVTID